MDLGIISSAACYLLEHFIVENIPILNGVQSTGMVNDLWGCVGAR